MVAAAQTGQNLRKRYKAPAQDAEPDAHLTPMQVQMQPGADVSWNFHARPTAWAHMYTAHTHSRSQVRAPLTLNMM